MPVNDICEVQNGRNEVLNHAQATHQFITEKGVLEHFFGPTWGGVLQGVQNRENPGENTKSARTAFFGVHFREGGCVFDRIKSKIWVHSSGGGRVFDRIKPKIWVHSTGGGRVFDRIKSKIWVHRWGGGRVFDRIKL